ncbi:ORFL150C [Human betaherpesvirus 5]|nr:ORFL150C [Human betaherpesvirus 5]QHX40481.1 ORFL150C [Human betaherpesvirus 5]
MAARGYLTVAVSFSYELLGSLRLSPLVVRNRSQTAVVATVVSQTSCVKHDVLNFSLV